MASKLQTRLAASAAAAVLLAGLAACGDDEETDVTSAPPAATGEQQAGNASALTPIEYPDPFTGVRAAGGHMPMTAAALAKGFASGPAADEDTDAAKLRADLTYLLSEHVYLAGLGINTALVAGPDDAKTGAALATLDKNSVALADMVGKVATDDQRTAFLAAWRAHIEDFVDYASAKTEAGERKEVKDLDAYEDAAGELLADITRDAIAADAVSKSLDTHVKSLLETIDAMKDGDTKAYDLLYDAAGHMPMTAAALAAAFDKAGKVAGDPNSDGAELRAGLTGLLTGHVYMAGTAVFTAYTAEGGAESEAFKAAAGALKQNTTDLTEAVGSVAADAEQDFNKAWAAHIADFVAYAQAAATDDAAAKAKELADLDGYTAAAGELFNQASDGDIPADAVADSLKEHVRQLAGTIDALAKALTA